MPVLAVMAEEEPLSLSPDHRALPDVVGSLALPVVTSDRMVAVAVDRYQASERLCRYPQVLVV